MRELEKNLDGTNLRIGVVLSRFNSDIGDGLLSACTAELLKLGVASEAITIATVPGALETPLILQHMACLLYTSHGFDLIALCHIAADE